MAHESCITFTVDRAATLRLRAAGATGGVISGLRSACVASSQTAAPPATASPRPAPTPARTAPAPQRVETAVARPSTPGTTVEISSVSPAVSSALANHAVTGIGFETRSNLDGVAQRGRRVDGSFYDYVIFDATAGDSLRIVMRSSAFTPYFNFGRALDCDSACSSPRARFRFLGGAQSRGDSATFNVRITETGPYALRVSATGRSRGRTGEYSIAIERR